MATRKDKASQTNGAPPEPRDQINTTSPLVFISHDTRDADLAEAFGNLLTDAKGSATAPIAVTALQKGIYIVKVEDSSGEVQSKLLVK